MPPKTKTRKFSAFTAEGQRDDAIILRRAEVARAKGIGQPWVNQREKLLPHRPDLVDDDMRQRYQTLCKTKRRRSASRAGPALQQDAPARAPTSEYMGVHQRGKRWRAQVSVEGKTQSIGTFDSELDAAEASGAVAARRDDGAAALAASLAAQAAEAGAAVEAAFDAHALRYEIEIKVPKDDLCVEFDGNRVSALLDRRGRPALRPSRMCRVVSEMIKCADAAWHAAFGRASRRGSRRASRRGFRRASRAGAQVRLTRCPCSGHIARANTRLSETNILMERTAPSDARSSRSATNCWRSRCRPNP